MGQGPRFWFRAHVVPMAVAMGLAGVLGWASAPLARRVGSEVGGVRLLSGTDVWLLMVFTAGVLVLLLAGSVWGSARFRSRGAREALLGAERPHGAPGSSGFWKVGGWLLLIYALGWLATG